ncbi:MAG: hypothetical protein QOF87_3941 [Pseudonocardiales bacterium]|jgi:hypothetical protein|nr:hypothetical protein [Pseudonocardiales bacterium]MDT4909678.1 hypothetical protein [Pseudonocardiales bacterium]MDT4960225.1 hypothetical protein [Pseudonocardiales bacterium]MDT4964294.1 hypothetical protein [Pseudonocardiales bacterium]MDT4979823.1 hypothetical protein [Pseudonocardiales bacterium]
MRRTRLADLAVPFFVIGITVYVLLRFSYSDLPPLKSFVPVPLAALAVAEYVASRRVRGAVRHDPDAKPMAAIVIARCVALGKASSLVGAGVVGAATGLLVRVIPDAVTVRSAANDTRVGIFLLVASVLLVGAGLLLERAGVDPGSQDRDQRGKAA